MSDAILPKASPKGIFTWAIGSIVLVVFALVVLQLLRERGIDPVGSIVRLAPMPGPAPTPAPTPAPSAMA